VHVDHHLQEELRFTTEQKAYKLARLSTSLLTSLIEFVANCILESPISGGRLQSAVQ
jgi:hypothetical protein